MVRDNWQTKAESVTARRVAAKQRKQQRESRGAYKHMMLDLFTMLDRHEPGAASPPPVIHMWTDSPPSDSPPMLDAMEGKRKVRSGSIGNERKVRSNSFHEEKKKAHPRSKEAAPEADEDVPRLCRQHFYSGKCSDKKGGCRHVHVPGQCKTLAQVVTDKAKPKDILSLSSEANDDDGDNTGGMDMIYYLSIDAVTDSVKDNAVSDVGVINLSDLASKKLADEACGIASVVYLAMNNHLLFDRYRGGVVVSDSEFESILQGNERRLRSTSVFSEDENDNVNVKQEHDDMLLPSHILEYILRFLPDVSVASMSGVCSAWRNEIGQDSPDMWRHMLERRQWPMAAEMHASGSHRDAFRRSFLRHYSVVRDIEAIKLAVRAITSTSRKIVEEKELVYQVFSARRLAPQSQNPCIAVRVWSANHVLIAYSRDCTLRLFKAVDKTADGASPRACRELVCVSVKPHKNTRKRYYQLIAMDLDEESIVCLFKSKGVGQGNESYKLTVTSRDAFLCADGSGTNDPGGATLDEEALQVIDVGDIVLNYLLSCGEVDHRLLPLFDFLSDLAWVDVLVSRNMHACGCGLFLLEMAISIPSPDWNEEGEEIMISLDRKIVLFSATAGAIVWMGDCNPTDSLLPPHEDVTMASFHHQYRLDERPAACSFAFVSSVTDIILLAELDPTGHMQCPTVVEASRLLRNELLENNWQMHRVRHRPVIITFSDVVVADTLFRELDGGRIVKKSVVSFYSRFVNNLSYATLTLDGDCEAIRMERMQDVYAVVLCRVCKFLNAEAAIDNTNSDDAASLSIEAIVIHVPSRRVIHRVCLLDEDSAFPTPGNYDIPILFAAKGDTVGVGLWWKGVILTGKDVREVGSNTLHAAEEEKSRGAKKQKKKQRQSTKGKKDGFARGMSLTG